MMDPFDARIVGEVEALRASRDAALARVGVLEAAKCDPDCVHCAAWRDRMGRYRSARAALSSPPPHQKEEP